LEVLGEARLLGDAEPLPLHRRAAAVLAYLALEGPTPKYRLAGMLWPDSGEDTARNNMRQLLRRLRANTGAALVLGTEIISLSGGVTTDALELQSHVHDSRYVEALALSGGLLGTLDFDDCPDFDAWLSQAREQVLDLRRRSASAASEACEQRGELAEALGFAQRLLALDPLAEEAYRRLMRLHYLAGDRASALGLFERCRQMLREEFDATPHPSTAALARDIERGQVRPIAASAPAPPLPLTLLRPSKQVGRQHEWGEMEEAWLARRVIVLMAEPGLGKTAESLAILKRVEAAGLLTFIHLDSLPPEAVEDLLGSLALPGPPAGAAAVTALSHPLLYTAHPSGGNDAHASAGCEWK
jgi:DNA-binding SARP family transcriptional activator